MTGRWMDDRPRRDPSGGGDSGPPLDDLAVDRLLDGRAEGSDAVPGHAHLAELLAAAAGPARPDELAGEAPALAAFRAARDAAAAPRGSATTATGRGAHPGHAAPTQVRRAGRRRRPDLAGRTRRAPAMVVALAMAIGGLCASATAAVVTMVHRPTSTVATTTAPATGPGSTPAAGPGGGTAPTTSVPPRPGGNVTGPDAPRHDRANLCNAWRSGNGNGAANKRKAQAFQELAEAAGGADRVEEYCRAAAPPTSAPKGNGNGESGKGEAKAGEHGPRGAENGRGSGASKGDAGSAKGLDKPTWAEAAAARGTAPHARPSNRPSRDRPKMVPAPTAPSIPAAEPGSLLLERDRLRRRVAFPRLAADHRQIGVTRRPDGALFPSRCIDDSESSRPGRLGSRVPTSRPLIGCCRAG